MAQKNIEPEYKIRYVKSESKPYTKIVLNEIASDVQEGNIVLWQFDKICTGIINNGKITWLTPVPDSDLTTHLFELRAFNENMEIRLWRNEKNELVGRNRTDADVKDGGTDGYEPITEPVMLLRGVVGEPLKKNQQGEYAVLTRQYIAHNDIGQAGYADYRFVEFVTL